MQNKKNNNNASDTSINLLQLLFVKHRGAICPVDKTLIKF